MSTQAEAQLDRLREMDISSDDYRYALALNLSVSISMLRSLGENGEKLPDMLEQTLQDMETILVITMRNLGDERMSRGVTKSALLLAAALRIAKEPVEGAT
jgi:hypothetical protein